MCDTGYLGTVCDECDAGFVSDGLDCVMAAPHVGAGVPGDPITLADGSAAGSCQAYRNPTLPFVYAGSTGDGVYLIDPLGTAPFEVSCDMTTGGGGFTYIDAPLANAQTMLDITSERPGEGTCDLSGDNPRGRDTGDDGHLCHFDFGVGVEFNEIIAAQLEMTARTTFNSDVALDSTGLWAGSCPSCLDPSAVGSGVRLGSATDPGPVFVLGEETGLPSGGVNLFNDGWVMGAFSRRASTGLSTTLRLEMTDTGVQSEGSEWTGGGVYVRRNDHQVTNALTGGDPGRYTDGSFALSCAEYFEGRFIDGLFYAGVRSSGMYLVDSDGPGGAAPVETLCHQGRASTLHMDWQREADPGVHTLASFRAAPVDELDPPPANVTPISNESEQGTHIRWNAGGYEVRSYRLDLPGNTSSRVSVEPLIAASGLEEGGLFVFATGDSGAVTNTACRQGSLSGNPSYTPETLALVPYECPDAQGEFREVLFVPTSRLFGTYSVDIGEPVRSVTLRVFRGSTRVHRWRVYTSP